MAQFHDSYYWNIKREYPHVSAIRVSFVPRKREKSDKQKQNSKKMCVAWAGSTDKKKCYALVCGSDVAYLKVAGIFLNFLHCNETVEYSAIYVYTNNTWNGTNW